MTWRCTTTGSVTIVTRAVIASCWASVCLVACAPKEGPFVPKPTTQPARVYCFDTIGHTPGAKPFILGGTCCCTPTEELMQQYRADGVVGEMTLRELLDLYKQRGIQTALDHEHCNNLCKWGPHVTKGGRCMVPPEPGTKNYEEIATGMRYLPEAPEGKHKK